jgi:hypothetical protein
VRRKKEELDKRMAAKTAFMAQRGIVDVTVEGSSALQQEGSLKNQLTRHVLIAQRIRIRSSSSTNKFVR